MPERITRHFNAARAAAQAVVARRALIENAILQAGQIKIWREQQRHSHGSPGVLRQCRKEVLDRTTAFEAFTKAHRLPDTYGQLDALRGQYGRFGALKAQLWGFVKGPK